MFIDDLKNMQEDIDDLENEINFCGGIILRLSPSQASYPSSLVFPVGDRGSFLPAVIRCLLRYRNIMCMAFSHAGIGNFYKSCIL